MRWLLITTIGKNPGDEWIRIGTENLIRQVDPDHMVILMDKEVPDDRKTIIKFDKCVWCGMPVFWSLDENRNAAIEWWKELMLNWPSERKCDFLVLGAGSFFPWDIKGPEEIVYLAELKKSASDVIARSFFVTARDGVVAQMTGAQIPAFVCPAVFSIMDYKVSNELKLANLMNNGSHYADFGPAEAMVWGMKKNQIARILQENDFVFAAHNIAEYQFAQQCGWRKIILYNGDPYGLLKYYGRCGKFFGNRIHGAIVARGNNADTWCVGYDSRLDAVRLSGARVSRPSQINLDEFARWASKPAEVIPFDMESHFNQQLDILRRFMEAKDVSEPQVVSETLQNVSLESERFESINSNR
jgi:hypothetical protein